MTYETAKKLKEAGFPQEDPRRTPVTITNETLHEFLMRARWDCYLPTLSELIEACGDNMIALQKGEQLTADVKSGWEAVSRWIDYYPPEIDERFPFGKGETQEEAVANLWLALNEKKQ